MMSGAPPFYHESDDKVYEMILEAQADFDDEIWQHISLPAKDLLGKLLCPQDKRISAAEAIQHPWVTNKKDNTGF